MTAHVEYQDREQSFELQRRDASARESRIVHLRMGTFVAVATCFVLGAFESIPRLPLMVIGGAALAWFIWLVVKHPGVLRKVRRLEELVRINREALARFERRWDDLPFAETEGAPENHLYAEDLDVTGPASLFHLVGQTPTVLGADRLRDWLLDPPDPTAIPDRQKAVAEMADLIDFRDEFVAAGRVMGDVRRARVRRFIDWARSPARDAPITTIRTVAWLIPISTVVFIALHALQIVPWLWGLSVVAAILTSVATHRITKETISNASPQGDRGARFSELFRVLHAQEFGSDMLRALKAELVSDDGTPAAAMIERLEKLVVLSDVRNSHFLYIIVQSLTLWDLHVYLGLHRWKRLTGHRVAGWFDCLAEIEGLAALGALAHAHPDWTFPEADTQRETIIQAQQLGHPLLAPAKCVRNDVTVGPPGTLLIVSGSNMSGKSTLLRALGTNALLARLGSKVCATSFSLPFDLQIAASGRIHDSLSAGVSFFLAEVRRLVAILDAVAEAGRDGHPTLCVLDELLQGTNAAERKIGVLRVLRRLLDLNAITAFATHDLSFRDDADVEAACTHVHFQELVDPDSPTLVCDYLLRPGVLTTGNAVHVMDVNGLTAGPTARTRTVEDGRGRMRG